MGKASEMDYRTVPACVFTYPEVAFVGKLEGKCGEFPLAASAKANCLGDTKGIFKVYEKDGIIGGAFNHRAPCRRDDRRSSPLQSECT